MIRATERAKEELLRRKRSAHIHDPGAGSRLASTRGGNLALVTDRMKAGDQVVKCQGSTVLLVQAELSELLLAGATIACRDGGELVVRRAGAGVRDPAPRRRDERTKRTEPRPRLERRPAASGPSRPGQFVRPASGSAPSGIPAVSSPVCLRPLA